MSFLHKAFEVMDPVHAKIFGKNDQTDLGWDLAKPKTPPPPPGVPNPNDAANAAQSQTDAMRLRRGMLANIYAGSQNQQPVTGKTTLGT
jgi:hypothetical protein